MKPIIEVSKYLDHHECCNWWLIVDGVRSEKIEGSKSIDRVLEIAERFRDAEHILIEKW